MTFTYLDKGILDTLNVCTQAKVLSISMNCTSDPQLCPSIEKSFYMLNTARQVAIRDERELDNQRIELDRKKKLRGSNT